MKTIDFFEAYVAHGLKVIPLLPFSKKPFFGNWQQFSLYNVESCRRLIANKPDYNLGLLLGEIIDVEGDSESANELLDELIGDVVHPRYRSSKSVHHLFLSPDRHLTRKVIGQIEFRGFNHQSVLPPSKHENGAEYTWFPGRGFPIPSMPPKLLKLLERSSFKNKKKPQHVELTCPACGKRPGVHRKRLSLEREACRMMNVRWECNKCRAYDLRPLARHLKAHK